MDNLNNDKKNCKTCGTNKGVIKTKRLVFITGVLLLFLSIYGLVSFVKDIMSYF